MKWHDYAVLVPVAIIIAIVSTPLLWAEAVAEIIAGAEAADRQHKGGN